MSQITVRNIPAAVESRLRTMADRLGLSLNQTVIRLCLDTTASSRLMRGQPKLRERLESADGVLLPVTVLGELQAGFKGGSRLAHRHGSSGLVERSGVGEDGGSCQRRHPFRRRGPRGFSAWLASSLFCPVVVF